MTPTDREVVNEKARQWRAMQRKLRTLKAKLWKTENENIGYGYAIQTLRYWMGLDNTKTDVSECLAKYEQIKARLDRDLQNAVNESCACGGKGPLDGCCPACEVWHRMQGRQVQDKPM